MKYLIWLIAFALCFGLMGNTGAGTLQNTDLDEYRIRVNAGGSVYESVAYGQAYLYNVCDYGGEVTLIKTGQTIKMNSDDYIVIEDGVMKRKDD